VTTLRLPKRTCTWTKRRQQACWRPFYGDSGCIVVALDASRSTVRPVWRKQNPRRDNRSRLRPINKQNLATIHRKGSRIRRFLLAQKLPGRKATRAESVWNRQSAPRHRSPPARNDAHPAPAPDPLRRRMAAHPQPRHHLHRRAMPIIRYKNGDLAGFTRAECPCGCKLPTIAELHGRTG
jgi:hypothetical protein